LEHQPANETVCTQPSGPACGTLRQEPGETRQDISDLPENYLLHRRFDRIGRLLGDETMARVFETHAMVIGLGGVGSWAAESLVRSGIGKITIIDFDLVCVTNINRQLHAMHGVIGRKKVEVMAERLKKINPKCIVDVVDLFYSEQTSDEILGRHPDVVLDAIDNVTAKCHLLAACHGKGIPVITAGGSGARLDPTQVRVVDVGETHTDPLFWAVRRVLRTKYGFPEGKLGIPAVFSAEVPTEPEELHYDQGKGFRCVCPNGSNQFHSCEKRNKIYGTAGFVTGTFGFVMASWVVSRIKDRSLGSASLQQN
jgi:tRNA A37 threonylcarbamoyladenosine dehydratase